MTLLDRLLRRPPVPGTVTLEADEHVLARATAAGSGVVVATSHGLWLPGEQAQLRWHLISKATWAAGVLGIVAAEETEVVEGAVLLADRPARQVRLAEPGRVPEIVNRRVTGTIRSRHHRDLPGGGAWFVQRTVPGRSGVVLQVRPDPGTDAAAVRQVTGDVVRTLRGIA